MKFYHATVAPAIVILIVLANQATAQESIVFAGYPISKAESTSAESNRIAVDESSRNEYRVLITKRDGKYYWTSRENKELLHVQSGAFHWFIAPASGYVKFVDQQLLSDKTEPRYLYMEHLTQFLMTSNLLGYR